MKPRRERPILVVWDGNAFIPLPRFKRSCDEQFAVHEEVAIVRFHARNMNQHRGYFASLHDAWSNLDHQYDGVFPSEDHFREWALCQTEFCHVTHEAYSTKADAMLAAKAARKLAPYAVISVAGTTVVTKHAMSQSIAAMGKETFEASCKAVLEVVAGMARTTPRELKKNAGRSA